ncbi:MAG TPA: response regulator transcription factor [Candidatus Limnocylindrales bacterium]
MVVIEDDDALEALIMAWLASHGMQTIPIAGSSDLDRETGTGPSSVRAPLSRSHVRGPEPGHLVGLSGHHRESTSPTVVLVVSPDVNGDVSASSESSADTIRQDESASVREWVDALLLKTHPNGRDHLTLGPLEIDSARRSVRILSSDIRLTPTEFRLLNYLAENAGRVVGHTELLSAVWNPGYADDIHLLQETIRSLRGRISLVTDKPVIESVYGAGYRMAEWDEQSPAPDGAEDPTADNPPARHPATARAGSSAGNQ